MFFTCSHTGHNVALPPPLLLSHPPLGCVRIPPALVSDWIVYMDPSLSCFSLAPFFHSLAPRRRVALPNHLVLTLLSLSLSLQLATRTSKSSLQNQTSCRLSRLSITREKKASIIHISRIPFDFCLLPTHSNTCLHANVYPGTINTVTCRTPPTRARWARLGKKGSLITQPYNHTYTHTHTQAHTP